MVDKLVSSDEKTTVSGFIVREENIFVEDGLFKEPGMVENIAQTAAARAGFQSASQNQPVRLGYIGGIKNLQFFGFPKINDEIITEITIENQIFDVSVISGKISCRGELLASCEMKIFIVNH